MTDLRTRIAAALRTMTGDLTYEAMADAVIRELGLRPEKGQRSNSTGPLWGGNNRHTVTRYVTEWTPDES